MLEMTCLMAWMASWCLPLWLVQVLVALLVLACSGKVLGSRAFVILLSYIGQPGLAACVCWCA